MTDWFGLVATLTDPRLARESLLAEVTLEDLDFPADLPCEGPHHPTNEYGHIRTQSAGFLVVGPCGNSTAMCDGWVQECRTNLNRYVDCECGRTHKLADLTYRKIGTP